MVSACISSVYREVWFLQQIPIFATYNLYKRALMQFYVWVVAFELVFIKQVGSEMESFWPTQSKLLSSATTEEELQLSWTYAMFYMVCKITPSGDNILNIIAESFIITLTTCTNSILMLISVNIFSVYLCSSW